MTTAHLTSGSGRHGVIHWAPNSPTPSVLADEAKYVVYWKRWVILFLYSAGVFLNGALWIAFAPISSVAAEYYGVSVSMINLFSLIFFILYLPGSILSSFLMQAKSLRYAMVLLSVFNAASGVIRYLGCYVPLADGQWRFWVVFIGQVFGALAQPLFNNAPSTIAMRWFGIREREQATAIATLVGMLGNAAGNMMSSLMVSGSSAEEGRGIKRMLLYQGICAVVILVLVIAFFDSDPPTPPSRSAALRIEEVERRGHERSKLIRSRSCSSADGAVPPPATERTVDPLLAPPSPLADAANEDRLFLPDVSPLISDSSGVNPDTDEAHGFLDITERILLEMWADCKVLLKNWQYLQLVLAVSLVVGLSNTQLTVVQQYVQPAGYSSEAGPLSTIYLTAGLLSGALVAPVLDRGQFLNLAFKIGVVAGTLSMAFIAYSLRPHNFTALAVAFGLYGAFTIPLQQIAISIAAETTYPIEPDNSSAIMWFATQPTSVLMTLLLNYLIELQPDYTTVYSYANYFSVGGMVLTSLVTLPFKGESRRFFTDVPSGKLGNGYGSTGRYGGPVLGAVSEDERSALSSIRGDNRSDNESELEVPVSDIDLYLTDEEEEFGGTGGGGSGGGKGAKRAGTK